MSGITRPHPGDGGPFICRKCGNNFDHDGHHGYNDNNDGNGFLLGLVRTVTGSDLVKCPKCGSFRTNRDPHYMY